MRQRASLLSCFAIAGAVLAIAGGGAGTARAQANSGSSRNVEQMMDGLMRRGDFPFEFKADMYKTATSGVGAYVGTIAARNWVISIAGRDEPALMLKITVAGLNPGRRAFHIHELPDCRAKEKDGQLVLGLAAGGHLYAEHISEGDKKIFRSHLGDLPNLIVAPDGTSSEEMVIPRLAVADLVNRSIIIHAEQDDNSAREVCGIFH